MDFLNKLLVQLSELLRSMTPAARITAGLLLLVIVVSLGYLFNHQMSGPDELLFGGEAISSDQIPTMEGAFAKANLSGWVVDGGRIRVPRGQRPAFMAALVDGKALPQVSGGPSKNYISESSNIFGMSKDKQNELHRQALQEELQLVIRNMRGIENARVFIDSIVESGWARNKKFTAAVSIKPTGNQPLDEERVPSLRHFVAAAVAGLSADSIAITDLNSGRTFAGENASGSNGTGMSDNYLAVKKSHEHHWEEKIRTVLQYIPGVVVSANVELTPELTHSETVTTYDPKIAVVDRTENTSNNSQQSGGPATAGRPGVTAQGAANQAASISGGSNPSRTQSETSQVKEIGLPGKTEKYMVSAPLSPLHTSVSISVPSSYITSLWQSMNPTPAGQDPKPLAITDRKKLEEEQKAKIQNYLKDLVPHAATTDNRPQIQVEIFDQITPESLPTVSVVDSSLAWLSQSWTTLGMGLLGAFSLVVLRSMVRSVSNSPISEAGENELPAAISPAVAAAAEQAAATTENPTPEAAPRRKRRAQTGPTLKDDLVEIVREDPDAAANILRTWIGSGA